MITIINSYFTYGQFFDKFQLSYIEESFLKQLLSN